MDLARNPDKLVTPERIDDAWPNASSTDRAGVLEPFDLVPRVADFEQHLLGVGAELDGGAANVRRLVAELHRASGDAEVAVGGVREALDVAVLDHLRIGGDFRPGLQPGPAAFGGVEAGGAIGAVRLARQPREIRD